MGCGGSKEEQNEKKRQYTAHTEKETSSPSKRTNTDFASPNLPIPRVFQRVQPLQFEPALTALLTSFKEAPEGRPDLKDWVPTALQCQDVINFANSYVSTTVLKRPSVIQLQKQCNLTDDEIKALFVYSLEDPYPVYKWLNTWLMSARRDTTLKNAIGPFFILLYRAMEKLPKIKSKASRSVIVNNIPALKATFDDYEKRCESGQKVSFWGFASFSTSDKVINSEQFMGDATQEAIIYTCPEVEGVDMEPFKIEGMNEKEILPLCPVVFEVICSVKAGTKLVITIKQGNHMDFAYVFPASSP